MNISARIRKIAANYIDDNSAEKNALIDKIGKELSVAIKKVKKSPYLPSKIVYGQYGTGKGNFLIIGGYDDVPDEYLDPVGDIFKDKDFLRYEKIIEKVYGIKNKFEIKYGKNGFTFGEARSTNHIDKVWKI